MRKKSARPLIAPLCLALLLLATPPALARITADFGSPSHPLTLSPVHPRSPTPQPLRTSAPPLNGVLSPSKGCNRPVSDMPPVPDNCSEYEPVAPPSEPIPPACIASARYQETEMYGEPLIQLQIKVDHPELCDNCRGTIELERYGYGLGNWSLSDIRADASCAKDEAPLAWATLQVLNHARSEAEGTDQLDALDIYTAPLPSFYLDLLAELGGWPDGNSTTTYHPPDAIQATWYADAERLDVDVYPDGEWQLAPDCYDWPASCWDIAGDRWSFRVARDDSGEWELVATSGDYTPGDHGMEQALVDATLTTLSTGDPTTFAIFDPAFDGCYIRLLLALREQELPASGMWPEAGPWSRCPF